MLRFKRLKKHEQLQEFCHQYEEACRNMPIAGFRLSVEFLKNKDKVIGIFDGKEMVAGYCLSNIPYSLVHNITPENKEKMEKITSVDNCYDLGNIWKKPGYSKSKFSSIVWPRIILDSLFFNTRKDYIVGYVMTGHGRTDAYNMAKPVYLQTSSELGGLNIFMMNRKNMAFAFVKGFYSEVKGHLVTGMSRLIGARG